jgi:hypothetical protein
VESEAGRSALLHERHMTSVTNERSERVKRPEAAAHVISTLGWINGAEPNSWADASSNGDRRHCLTERVRLTFGARFGI